VHQPPEAIRPTRHVQMVRGILLYRKQRTKFDTAEPDTYSRLASEVPQQIENLADREDDDN